VKAICIKHKKIHHLILAFSFFKNISSDKKLFRIVIQALKDLLFNKKPCHCNKIFLCKTRLILLLNHFIPRCAYYNPYFAFRRTGTHPPFYSL